jgi:hypothetical protein
MTAFRAHRQEFSYEVTVKVADCLIRQDDQARLQRVLASHSGMFGSS